MRVDIITKHSSYNFGAMLQAYALGQTIASLGAECKIIDLRQKKPLTLAPWTSLNYAANNISYILNKKDILLGRSRFEYFIQNYNKTDRYNNEDELKNNIPEADVYIVGSDQVWNPKSAIMDSFWLRFAPPNAIRASYAASLGSSFIPEGVKSVYREYLSDMDYISVREETGKQLLGELTDKNISVNIDPVFLLNKEQWYDVAVKSNIKEPYILCYILYSTKQIDKWLNDLHKATGKKIIKISTSYARNMVNSAGPKEFLGLLQGADFVISSSFHGVALSIAHQKPFYAIVNPDSPTRISDMLHMFKLSDRLITENSPLVLKDVDYAETNKILEAEREKSFNYLAQLVTSPKKAERTAKKCDFNIKDNISVIGDKCTACTVCEHVCPTNAISLIKNSEGFIYPAVNEDKCIHCGKCLQRCHTIIKEKNSKESSKAYYGWHKNDDIRMSSSSGGVFTAISDMVLKENGLVVAAYYDAEKKEVFHATSDDLAMERFRKSKYVESNMSGIINKIECALKNDRKVLFCGTPCQCAGVREAFGHCEKLILCDFLCHGVPSAMIFKDFLELTEKKAKDQITDYQFRTKTFGWSQYGIKIKFKRKKEKNTVGRCEWFFVAGMLDNKFLRKSCYTCNKAYYHQSDITIGDFWGVVNYNSDLNDNKGISLVLTNNAKGEALLKSLDSSFISFPLEKRFVDYAFNIKKGDTKIPARDRAFKEYSEIGIENYIKKHYKKRMLKYKAVFALKKHSLKKEDI